MLSTYLAAYPWLAPTLLGVVVIVGPLLAWWLASWRTASGVLAAVAAAAVGALTLWPTPRDDIVTKLIDAKLISVKVSYVAVPGGHYGEYEVGDLVSNSFHDNGLTGTKAVYEVLGMPVFSGIYSNTPIPSVQVRNISTGVTSTWATRKSLRKVELV